MFHSLFTEFEAYAETIQKASIDMRLPLLKKAYWEIMHASVGTIHIQYAREGGGNIAEGSTFRQGWAFFQQTAYGRDGLANGRMLAADEVFVIPPGAEFCLACQPEHEWVSVFISDSELFGSTELQELATPKRAFVLKPVDGLAQRLRSLVIDFLSTAKVKPMILSTPATETAFRDELVSTIHLILQSPKSAMSKHFDRWRDQTGLAIKSAAEQPANSISLSTLAQVIRVPERTLRTAFQRQYGMSPAEYLRIDRLHDARRMLRASCPDQTSVTEVATALGFWDLGRFATRYRKLFGEKPSATLQTSNRSSISRNRA